MWEWTLLFLFVIIFLVVFSQIRKEPSCSQCSKSSSS